ncbi:DNA helicase Rep [Thorsellia anophelis]|uniref:ATP-dependent DNA helicase Rep n=1 Tax=Thorsellia anophelis DSM 18579 TaxID=1123402 RepID=A0A1I0C0C4_9GAMM|nr:DNA helicase Rep [Thorsellia anophelis]SET12806.1 ATP-dependent DNA helicase Rep [Thorsellia anophelis DSM 18579]
MKLNDAQQSAVEFVTGPCLVLAGAGSGKTRVITNKIAHLIRVCGYEARQIAAVTFTNKAAREMKERVAATLGKKEARGLLISTFHTLGLEIIKREHKVLELKSNFSLFDDQDQLALLKELTEPFLKEDKTLLMQLTNRISRWKNDIISPKLALESALSQEDKIFAHCYQLYETQTRSLNVLDFDDLILLPTKLLIENQEVRERWQQKIKYLLVDEYQDTNTSQYQLIKMIVGTRARFTVVGDDDQSIYSWRGAQPQNMALLKRDFPNLNVIKLEQNYRSTARILKAANILIANNPHLFDKKLFCDIEQGEQIKVLASKNEENEAERVVAELISHRFLQNTDYKQYAILYRSNHQSRLIEKVLMQNRIPYKISGGTSFFARAEIKDIMAYLRVLTNSEDDTAFLRIVNTPRREIGPTTLQKLGEFAKSQQKSLFSASFDIGPTGLLTSRQLGALQQFTIWLDKLSEHAKNEPLESVKTLLTSINYDSWLFETSPSQKAAEMRVRNVNQLYEWLGEMLKGDELEEPMTLTQAVNRFTLRDMLERGEDEQDADQVQLMTIHASKGLEFDFVYILGMEEGIMPHQNSIDDNQPELIEEERRLAYVGITRAKKTLTLSHCLERRSMGEVIKPEPSRFLAELPQDDLDWESKKAKDTPQQRMEKGQAHLAMLKAKFPKKG